MKDSIKRQDAIDAIVTWTVEDRPDIEMPTDLIDRIRNLPSAEPEIIKCKDCKNWDTTWQARLGDNCHYCPLVDGIRMGDWYCAYAERETR